jgi:hypothetical protein
MVPAVASALVTMASIHLAAGLLACWLDLILLVLLQAASFRFLLSLYLILLSVLLAPICPTLLGDGCLVHWILIIWLEWFAIHTLKEISFFWSSLWSSSLFLSFPGAAPSVRTTLCWLSILVCLLQSSCGDVFATALVVTSFEPTKPAMTIHKSGSFCCSSLTV